MELGEFTLGIITNLLSSIIYDGIKSQPYFQRRKIERRVEDATAEIVEPLLPFLKNEGISEDKQRRLIETCVDELSPLAKNPELLFQGSLNGQKIFEDLYTNRDLPQVVVEDGLKDVYTLLCPRIATLICKIPAAVKDWENEAWSENFRRFDEITDQLRTLFHKVDELATSSSQDTDALLTRVRQVLAQKIRFNLDLTGLRGDSPSIGKFDDFFIHPQIREAVIDDNDHQFKVVGSTDASFNLFTSSSQRAIVIGQAGAGKSTWAKWLQREALSTRWTGLCIRVELRRFGNEPLLSLHQLVQEAAGQHLADELTPERIGIWLRTGRVVLILDGFDEIRPCDRDRICEWIIDLNPALQKCPFIITSRYLTTDHLEQFSGSWHSWIIEPFDTVRIVDYIQRWYAHMPLLAEGSHTVEAEELAQSWLRDPTIGHLTGNPLLLSTLLMVHHLDGSLPNGRSALYQRYVSGMLGLWDDRRKVAATSISLSLDQKKEIMRGFALQMFLQQKDQLDENDALKLMHGLLQRLNISLSEEEVLGSLRERSGLIIGPGIYSFVHKTVLEYLVSESILQGDQRDEFGRRIDRLSLLEHRNDDRWNTVTFLWAGLAPVADVESFIEACIDARAWDLACGILYDQYSKFKLEIRRRLLLSTICVDDDDIFNSSKINFLMSYINKKVTLELPNFSLRSLASSSRSIITLMNSAVEDGTLAWLDSVSNKGNMRHILWVVCATKIKDIEVWGNCIANNSPDNDMEYAWSNFILQVVFKRILTEELIELGKVIIVYQSACPKLVSLIPMALISTGLNLFAGIMSSTPSNNASYAYLTNIFEKILKVLPNSNNNQINEELLLGTREWHLVFQYPTIKNLTTTRLATPSSQYVYVTVQSRHTTTIKSTSRPASSYIQNGTTPSRSSSTVDLLKYFIDALEVLAEKGRLEKDATYKSAINFVNDLIQTRESLAASQTAIEPATSISDNI
ncbi:MAG: NACHT domain-containing protein [Pseudanabaena sp. M046S1SP1A06QC]|nr:NACHT domain-containing protein [Pseudanabaena sp. M046S1SP1A06QC]